MGNIGSILSFRIDRAYGVVRTAPPVVPSTRVARDATPAETGPSAKIRNLVGAIVPGGITFDSETGAAAPTTDSLPMYRRPEDRNAAAVGVELGRTLDVRG